MENLIIKIIAITNLNPEYTIKYFAITSLMAGVLTAWETKNKKRICRLLYRYNSNYNGYSINLITIKNM